GRGSVFVCHRAPPLPFDLGRRTGSGSPAMTWAWAWFACCIVRPTEVDARNTVGRSPLWRPVRWRADRAAWLATSYTYRVGSISKVVTRRRLHEPDPTRAWWRSRTPAERLAHLQELRCEYYGWSDGAGPRLQRVHRILRRA